MRAALKWTFLLSTLASAIALLWPNDVEDPGAITIASQLLPPRTYPKAANNLPSALPKQSIQITKKDPFAPPPLTASSNAPVVAPPQELPLPAPMNYRYLGSFTDPNGARVIYLSRDDRTVSVRLGTQLDGGYLVEAIDATSVKVLHVSTQTRIDIPIAQNKEFP